MKLLHFGSEGISVKRSLALAVPLAAVLVAIPQMVDS